MVKRRRRRLVVDFHCHCKTPAVEPLAALYYAPELEPMDMFSNDRTREVNRQQGARIAPQLTSVEQRISDMDRMGVDVQAVSTSPLQFHYWTPPEVGREICRLVNANIAGMVARNPERFVGLAHVPMQDGQMAAAELARCVKDLGFRGAEIGTNIAGVEISDSRFEPFWKKAEELGAVVFIHPHGFTEGRRLSDHYFSNVIGNPLDTTVALSHLVFDGVLDRHPRLKIVSAHGGGFVGSYPFRMDHAHGARPDCRERIKRKPTWYLGKLYFDTLVWDHKALRHLVDLWGADHVVAGTDYPFDMGSYDPVGFVSGAEFLKRAEKDAILGGNAAKLLGIRADKYGRTKGR
ncbi:MAG TPA: amidohydrolase family protein [Burkholderiales bacterium]|nr:amidohydrolase family protein [Burkholderiales bacterium]